MEIETYILCFIKKEEKMETEEGLSGMRRLLAFVIAVLLAAGCFAVSPEETHAASLTYAKYTGVDYTKYTSNKYRLAALNKAKQMVTVKWKAPCSFVTWASSKGTYNSVKDINGKSSKQFIKGRTYTGVPYSMNQRTYDDKKWISLLNKGISANGMKARYSGYRVAGTKYGIDCSYFVCTAYNTAMGTKLNLNTKAMLSSSKFKKLSSFSQMKPGDVFLKSGHVMMYVGKSGSKYAVFEACAGNSKCSYNTYTASALKSYKAYRYTGFGSEPTSKPTSVPNKNVTVTPTVKANQSSYTVGQSAKVSWNSVANATGYWLDVYYGGNKIASKAVKGNSSYTISPVKQGSYTIYISAYNSKSKKIGKCTFKVNNKASVTTTPTVRANASSYSVGQSAKVSWNSVANATGYWLDVYYGGNKIASKAVKGGSSYTVSPVKQGSYTVYISAYNDSSKKIGQCTFKVNYPAGGQTVSDGEYYITSALDGTKCLNIKSYSQSDGGNVQLWASTNDSRQTFNVTYLGGGYYKITAKNSGKALDVKSSGMNSGTNVQQWKYAGTANQQWIIKMADDWSFYIISKHSGLYLDAQGGKSANGTNVQVHAGNGTAAQKWRFVACGAGTGRTVSDGTYHVVSALDNSKSLNVKNCSKSDGANVHLWTKNTNQRYSVQYLGNGFYKLTNTNSGKSLDVNRGATKCGANVQQWAYAGETQQQWILKSAGNGYYYIIARNSGLYLDAQGGYSSNGTNVQVYLGNGTASQKWKFVK